jgi:20S proteasome alpha/beta subunit
LASCGEAENPGYLWLVDATGAYRVRAHAVGGGPMAGTINECLEETDFSTMDSQEASKKLLEMFHKLEDLPAESRVEMAAVKLDESSGKRTMQRLFSSRLFGVAT